MKAKIKVLSDIKELVRRKKTQKTQQNKHDKEMSGMRHSHETTLRVFFCLGFVCVTCFFLQPVPVDDWLDFFSRLRPPARCCIRIGRPRRQ